MNEELPSPEATRGRNSLPRFLWFFLAFVPAFVVPVILEILPNPKTSELGDVTVLGWIVVLISTPAWAIFACFRHLRRPGRNKVLVAFRAIVLGLLVTYANWLFVANLEVRLHQL